jgi:sulfur relay protein TusB/DsrH
MVLNRCEPEALEHVDDLKEKCEVGIVLMQDAVYMAQKTNEFAGDIGSQILEGVQYHLLSADVERRGLGTRLVPGVTLVDYEGLVDLLFREDQTVLNV